MVLEKEKWIQFLKEEKVSKNPGLASYISQYEKGEITYDVVEKYAMSLRTVPSCYVFTRKLIIEKSIRDSTKKAY